MIQITRETDERQPAAKRSQLATDEIQTPIECWCLHGAVGAASDWRTLNTGLARHGIATRAVDLWRFLQCESTPLENFAAQLNAEAAGEIRRDTKKILLGYSMGGRLALHAILQNGPWDAAIIISAHPGLQDPTEISERSRIDTTWATKALTSPWAQFLSDWSAQPILKNQIRDEREDKRLMQRRREIARSFMDWSLSTQKNLWPKLPQISIPTLWIAGENDPKFSEIAKQAASTTPRSTLALAKNTHHRVPWENPEWTLKTIHQFLTHY